MTASERIRAAREEAEWTIQPAPIAATLLAAVAVWAVLAAGLYLVAGIV